jgi:hypothetical protein
MQFHFQRPNGKISAGMEKDTHLIFHIRAFVAALVVTAGFGATCWLLPAEKHTPLRISDCALGDSIVCLGSDQ